MYGKFKGKNILNIKKLPNDDAYQAIWQNISGMMAL